MSTDRPQRLRYILRKEHIANKKEKGILSRHKTGDEINVLPGTLWEDYEDKQTKKHEKIGFSYFSSLDFENLILSCPPSDVTRINHGEYELLASISTCADRMKVFEDKTWIGEGLTLDVGSYVHIHRYPNLPEKAPGVIKYKGTLSGIKGLWFGVELLEHRGKGCTNGMYRGHRYFVTDVDCGIFVTIARIRKCPDDNRHDVRQPQQQQQRLERDPEPTYQASPQYQASSQQHQQTICQNATSPPLPNLPSGASAGLPKDKAGENYDLKISERVVWLEDSGPEFGCVRWIGTLPDKPEEILVGVEFDNAVGSGTGRYKEHQLFRTKPNHAYLIPILGLMKEDEYINPTPVKMPIGAEAVSASDREEMYGLFGPHGFYTDYDKNFSPCEAYLRRNEDLRRPDKPEDLFDQTYPLDLDQEYTGVCLIINQFTNDRIGSQKDVFSIIDLFEKKFRFRVDYRHDLSKVAFLETFHRHHNYMADPRNKVQRFVCFILGHGDERGIMTCVDGQGSRFHIETGQRVDVNKDLLPLLSSSKLPTMAGKPKLFFVQACQGHAIEGGQATQFDADPIDGNTSTGTVGEVQIGVSFRQPSIPDYSDILIAFAVSKGFQAMCDIQAGSWFIQAVIDIFRVRHEDNDVLSMMTMVSNAVSLLGVPLKDGTEQKESPCIQNSFRKKMYMLK